MLRIAIAGATGRMGRMLIDAVLKAPDMTLAAALAPADVPEIGQDPAAATGAQSDVHITADLNALHGCDVLIDFTRPAGTMRHIAACEALGLPIVIGTTGFTPEERARIAETARHIPVVLAANMSVGVNAAMRLIAEAARLLAQYDCEIVEMHHSRKVDAPSGTALEMGRAVARARGQTFEDVAVLSREGHTGERREGTIGFATLRGGDVVGDHTVIFAGPGERIEISHKSGSRAGYAAGALAAARFLAGRAPGLYDMPAVLGMH